MSFKHSTSLFTEWRLTTVSIVISFIEVTKTPSNHYFLGQLYLSAAFRDIALDSEEINLEQKKQVQFQLYQALSVLGIKVSTFHSHLANGRKEDSRLMLEKALLERTSHCKQKPEFAKNLQKGLEQEEERR